MKKTKWLLAVLVLLCVGVPLAVAEDETTYLVGDHIQFGTYPQTRVDETTELQAAANAATWKSYDYYTGTGNSSDGLMTPSDYMEFADFFCNGEKFRAVKFTQYRPFCTGCQSDASESYQDDNGYAPNNTYYFKYEPLTWRVLNPSTGYIMCESIIDSQAYQNMIYQNGEYYDNDAYEFYYDKLQLPLWMFHVYVNSYARSSIRIWLNFDFYETAFTADQKEIIKTTTLSNEAFNTHYGKYGSAATNDKIYLLSYFDTLNTSYGFSSSYDTYDSARRAQGTDYAKCQGLHVYTDYSYRGNSQWWLRSGGADSYSACGVQRQGFVYCKEDRGGVSSTDCGIRPACNLANLTSDISQSDDLFSAVIATHEHQASEPVKENETISSCTQEGSYDIVIYCVNCGEEISRQTITTEKLAHTDLDNNGKCDSCDMQMTGGDHCKYCGQIHGGAFGWLVKIFHNIFALFKR